jgi:hypothetical protein
VYPTDEQQTEDNLTEDAWDNLLYDIGDMKCIPFIGPGGSDKWIQIDGIAREWAEKYRYP